MDEAERNKRLIEEHYAAFWSGDEALVRRQLASDFVDHGLPGAAAGPESAIAFSRGVRGAFPDMKVKINSAVAQNDRVAVHATWAGRHKGPFRGIPATNKAVSFEGMVFWRIADGKIAERWGILDMAAAMKQISD